MDIDRIRETAARVAASHGLDIVELEFHGAGKHRILRVFIEKGAEERKKLAETGAGQLAGGDNTWRSLGDRLAGVNLEDCERFSRDFGTVLDVEELIPGSEYTLEVSSPGLDRKLHGIEDYRRFSGMLVKVQTFEPVAGNRHWQGRLTEVSGQNIRLEPKSRGSGRGKPISKQGSKAPGAAVVDIALSNIERAQLVPEF